ncbi:MAG: radical SAM protein, partial [Calditrichaeota bacterium]
MSKIVLISTYELGRPPFGLASAAAQLQHAGFAVQLVDAAIHPPPDKLVAEADLIGLYLPMHTATRLALALLPRLRSLNPQAPIVAFGLYAPLNARWLQEQGVSYCIGGEFESRLVELASALLASPGDRKTTVANQVVLDRIPFLPPKRDLLPPLENYARLVLPDGSQRLAGYTEASRGCKHHCRHCPVVPVYGGRFRVVPVEVVLEDVAAQVALGAQHITFG